MTLSLKSTTRQTQTQTIETVSREEDAQNTEANIEAFLPQYISTLSYIERLHRLLLDVIKDEFERLRIANVTSVQALLLFNIGEKEVNASELRSRGYYQGTNVSYNLKKLVDSGYIRSEQCTNDRRSVRLSLTNEGRNIRLIVCGLWARQVQEFVKNDVMQLADFEQLEQSMRTLERSWTDKIRYLY